MGGIELIYMFTDFIRKLLSTEAPTSFSVRYFGFEVTEPLQFTPEQIERHRQSALFFRKFFPFVLIVWLAAMAYFIVFALLGK